MKTWSRSDTLALAYHQCTNCNGIGLKMGRQGGIIPCNCVLRAIFRVCYNHYRDLMLQERHMSRASLDFDANRQANVVWGRRDEEYIADFYLVTKRTLDEEEWRLFRFRYVLGGDWKLCCKRLGMDRGSFFHAVYRIEQKLGRIYRDLEPYALFPLDEYFYGTVRAKVPCYEGKPTPEEVAEASEKQHEAKKVVPIRPPVTKKPEIELPEEKAA